jgi:hypothetical protein
MSPQPAIGANGAGSRPAEYSRMKFTPSSRTACNAVSIGNGAASSPRLNAGTRSRLTHSATNGTNTASPTPGEPSPRS